MQELVVQGSKMARVTISVIKADIGSLAGHHIVPDQLLEVARTSLAEAKRKREVVDYYVTAVGDDLQLIMTHKKGENSQDIHGLAWEIFKKATDVSKELGLYGAGQDLLSDAFSGNLRGMGPGFAEIEIEERPAEPFVVFMADKTEPGAFNLPMFKIFADPFNTAGLVISPKLHDGFIFEVLDVHEGKKVELSSPEEMYDILALIGTPSRYIVRRVYTKGEKKDIAAAISTTKLSLIAGKYVGKDDPVAIVRAQSQFPALGEILEPFAMSHLVAGWMRGSHHGPLMPVSLKDARPSRFDGPPRVVGLGFNVKNGKLIGPSDLLSDVSFDRARKIANEIADYLRRHGPFMPHRLGSTEMEYTTLPEVLEKLKDRFESI